MPPAQQLKKGPIVAHERFQSSWRLSCTRVAQTPCPSTTALHPSPRAGSRLGHNEAEAEEHDHKKRPRDFEDDNDNAPTA